MSTEALFLVSWRAPSGRRVTQLWLESDYRQWAPTFARLHSVERFDPTVASTASRSVCPTEDVSAGRGRRAGRIERAVRAVLSRRRDDLPAPAPLETIGHVRGRT